VIAVVRPHSWDFPLFLHVTGAILLFGVLVAVLALSLSGRKRPEASVLADAAFWSVLACALPAWVVMRVGAQWIYSKWGFDGHNDPTWVGIGFGVSDAGLLVILLLLGATFLWRRKRVAWPAWTATGLSALYIAMLAIAWLAMSGKWS
jgi:hypothetical protein